MTKEELEALALETFGWDKETFGNWMGISNHYLRGYAPKDIPRLYQNMITEFALRCLSDKLMAETRFQDLIALLIEHGLICPECDVIYLN